MIQPALVRHADSTFINEAAELYANDGWSVEELQSVLADALRLIRSIAKRYADPTCVELNEVELEAEGKQKLIQLLAVKRLLHRITPSSRRGELFAMLKTCFKRHADGILSRCRFTVRRMGRKVPPKGSGLDYDRRFKPEVSLEGSMEDDHMSRAVERAASRTESPVVEEWDRDMEEILNYEEMGVYKQLTRPNLIAFTLAKVEAWRGRKPGGVLKITVTPAHLARGLGMSLEVFNGHMVSLREKALRYEQSKSTKTIVAAENSYHTAVLALERIFDVQVPRTSEPLVVRRIFTISARAEYEKVTPQVIDLLKMVGARPPEADRSGILNCFGILFLPNHQTCRSCDLYEACQAEAANIGLTDVALSPKLLQNPRYTQIRTAKLRDTSSTPKVAAPDLSVTTVPEAPEAPKVQAEAAEPDLSLTLEEVMDPSIAKSTLNVVPGELPEASAAPRVRIRNPRPVPLDLNRLATTTEEAELMHLVEGAYYGFWFGDDRYYSHGFSKGKHQGMIYLFCLKRYSGALRLRFVRPSDIVRSQLDCKATTALLPNALAPDQILKLLDQHATERLVAKPNA
jgi:hypothetical protein